MNKNHSFTKLNSKMIAKICRTLIALTLFAYLVDIILINSKSFRDWNFKNNTILTDFNIFIIVFCSFFFIFAIFYECFYNLKERIKIKILRYTYIILAGLIICLTIFSSVLMILKISKFVEMEVVMVFGVITFLMFLLMFIFMLIDKITRKVFKIDTSAEALIRKEKQRVKAVLANLTPKQKEGKKILDTFFDWYQGGNNLETIIEKNRKFIDVVKEVMKRDGVRFKTFYDAYIYIENNIVKNYNLPKECRISWAEAGRFANVSLEKYL